MAIQIVQKRGFATEKNIKGSHHLFVLDSATLKTFPFHRELDRKLKRTDKKMESLTKSPITMETQGGHLLSFVVLDKKKNTFQRHTAIRKALQPLLSENPPMLTIGIFGSEDLKEQNARAAIYVALMNSQTLPSRKKENLKKNIKLIELFGVEIQDKFTDEVAIVSGNTLTRELTMLPPNELTPSIYRTKIKSLAKSNGWKLEEFDMTKLKKMAQVDIT